MNIKIGEIYEHVKTGNKYQIIYLAKDSETLEEMVVYETLYVNEVSNIWVRSKKSFEENILNNEGVISTRFRLIL
jgi:hypothetical protein